jgi:hypothetical protein
MKRVLTVVLLLAMATTVAMAGWNFSETVFDFSEADTMLTYGTDNVTGEPYFTGNDPHGVVIDGNGNYWLSIYHTYGSKMVLANGDTTRLKPLRCFAPDGSIVHEIDIFDLPGGGLDTLHSLSVHSGSGVGISLDNDGNILYSSWAALYRFNAETGECMNRYIWNVAAGNTEAVQAPDGTIYLTKVLAGDQPVIMLDTDFEFIGNAVDTLGHITRSLVIKEAAAGGYDLYTGTTWNGMGVPRYHSDDPFFDTFVPVDTLMRWENPDGEVDPVWSSSLDLMANGNIIVGALQSGWGGYYGGKWYILDTETDEMVATFGEESSFDDANTSGTYMAGGSSGPRGAFELDENTIVTCDYYTGTVDKWVYSTNAIDEDINTASKFELKQNYPNPFNPSTTIPFVLNKNVNVTLTVYNMLGQKVATVIDNEMTSAGMYNVQFNATNLATGMYIYRINAGNLTQTRRMMFIK